LTAVLATIGLTGVAFGMIADPAGASVTATYSCASALGNYSAPVGIHAVPSATTYKPGAAVALNGAQLTLTVPSTIVAQVESAGVTSVSGVLQTFNVTATDALPAIVNVAGKGYAIPNTKLPNPPRAVSVKVPAVPVNLKDWKAGTKAGTMTFRTGSATLKLNDNLGIPVTLTCLPEPIATIATAKVS
jgi:hypothetical protein